MKTYFMLLFAAPLIFFAVANSKADEPPPLPLPRIDHAYTRVEQLLAALPSGTSVDEAQFQSRMGAEVASYLHLLGVTNIDSLNGAVKLSLSAPYNGKTHAGTKFHMDKEVTFYYWPDTSGTMLCSDVTGLSVKPFRLLGWMPLTEILVKVDPASNTVFTVHLDTIIGSLPHTKKVSPDGKVLP